MTNDKFRLEANKLIRKGIADRAERMAAVSALIDIYVEKSGDSPDSSITDKLTDYLLHEELTDFDPNKVSRDSYPVFSENQKRLRSQREVSLSYVNKSVSSDNVDIVFYDTPELRLKYEIDREVARYNEINRSQPVFTRKMTAEEYASIKPHPKVGMRGKEHADWSLDVRRRDNFTCQKCGKSKGNRLHAHHIEAYSTAIYLRYDLYNGITLCEKCHGDFHAIYGKGGNTRAQLEEWMEDGSYYEF